MKGKLGCLINNTSIIKDVEEILYELAAENIGVLGKDFKFSTAYKTIRDLGIEIDQESLSVMYKNVFNTQDGNFSTDAEIDKITGATFKDHLDKVVNARPFMSTIEIGGRSPGAAAADDMIKLYEDITNSKFGAYTTMRRFKDLMAKAARSYVNKKANIQVNEGVVRAELDSINDTLKTNNNLTPVERNKIERRSKDLQRHLNNIVIDMEVDSLDKQIEAKQEEIDLYRGNTNTQANFNKAQEEQRELIKQKKKYIDNNPKTKEEDNFVAILSNAFLLNQTGYETLSGGLNSTFEVVEEFKQEIEKYIAEIESNGGLDQQSINQFKEYANEIIRQKYDLLLSQKDMHNIIKTALVKKGIAKPKKIASGEEIMVFDWSKITNAAQDTKYMQDIVSEALREELDANGNRVFDENQISVINDSLKREYERYRADIIESRLKNLEVKNKVKPKPERPNKAKTIVSLYNMGWFETEPSRYDKIINDLVGLDNLDIDTFNKLQDLGKALNVVYSHNPGNEDFTKSVINRIAEDVAIALNDYQKKTKIASITIAGRELKMPIYSFVRWYAAYMGLVMRSTLMSVSNALTANQISGWIAVTRHKINSQLMGLPYDKDYYEMANEAAWAVHRDIRLNGGQQYGDLASTFYTRGEVDLLINKVESKTAQEVMSFVLGKTLLDASDSYFKVKLTMHKMFKNMTDVIVKIREDEYMVSLEKKYANISSATTRQKTINNEFNQDKKDRIKAHRDAAMAEISSKMNKGSLGQKRIEAKEIINEINKNTKVLDDSPEAVTRLAHDLLKSNLLEIGGVKKEHIMAAFNASYKAAGYEIGHVPNNYISANVKKANQHLAQMVEKAKKSNDIIAEAKYSFLHTAYNTIANPFLGGGSNWTMIAFENTGYGYLRSLWQTGKEINDIDSVLTDKGMASLEESLYNENKRRIMKVRGATGFILNSIMFATVMGALAAFGSDSDDEKEKKTKVQKIYSFFLDNKWVYKYIKELPFQYVKHGTSIWEGDLTTTYEFLGLQYEIFDYGSMWKDVNELRAEGKDTYAEGKIGEIFGKVAGSPIPLYKMMWQFYELSALVKGFNETYGDDSKKWWDSVKENRAQIDYGKSLNFAQGFFKSGFFNTINQRDVFGLFQAEHTISTLPGAGKATLDKLKELNINSIDDLKKDIIEKGQLNNIQGYLQRIKKEDINGKKSVLFNKGNAQQIEEILLLDPKDIVPLSDIFTDKEQLKAINSLGIYTTSYLAAKLDLIKVKKEGLGITDEQFKDIEQKAKDFLKIKENAIKNKNK